MGKTKEWSLSRSIKKKKFEIDSTGSILLDSVQSLINRTEESTSSQRSIPCVSADAFLGTDVYL